MQDAVWNGADRSDDCGAAAVLAQVAMRCRFDNQVMGPDLISPSGALYGHSRQVGSVLALFSASAVVVDVVVLRWCGFFASILRNICISRA